MAINPVVVAVGDEAVAPLAGVAKNNRWEGLGWEFSSEINKKIKNDIMIPVDLDGGEGGWSSLASKVISAKGRPQQGQEQEEPAEARWHGGGEGEEKEGGDRRGGVERRRTVLAHVIGDHCKE